MRTRCLSARLPRRCRRTPRADAMLGFGPVRIQPGETARVVARPRMLFKGTRLAYVGPARTFVLTDILVGWNSQLAGSMQTPMELFPPLPTGLGSVSDWLNNCGRQRPAAARHGHHARHSKRESDVGRVQRRDVRRHQHGDPEGYGTRGFRDRSRKEQANGNEG